MKTYLVLLFSAIFSLAQAQDTLSFDYAFVEQGVSPGEDDVAAYANIINPENRRMQLRWVRRVNNLPGGWASAVCDTNQCYLPTVDSADFTITPLGTAPIQPHVYPDGTMGTAEMVIEVYEVGNPGNSASATFVFSPTSSARDIDLVRLQVFPNPTNTSFQIESEAEFTQVELHSLTGQLSQRFERKDGAYDVSHLPRGQYIVTLRNEQYTVVGVKRLNIN